jgi:aryl-alcohol dehydrogenase-like predicted oxidoreductase
MSSLTTKSLSRIALGSAQFGLQYGIANSGERVNESEAHAILSEAWQQGVRTLDTAAAYGDSEEVLGRHGVENWQVISKLPLLTDDLEDISSWVMTSTKNTLRRLKIGRLHALLLHRPQQLLGPQGPELLNALKFVQRNGWVEKIGVSIYDPDELSALLELHPFELVQSPASILDQRLHRSGWARQLHQAGIEIHTRSAYLQGLLLSPTIQKHRFAPYLDLWDFWNQWLEKQNLTPLQACIQFALAQPYVDKIVLGVDTTEQFHAMVQAAEGEPHSSPEWPAIDPQLLNPSLWPN